MLKWQKILLVITLVGLFLLVYSPHFTYSWPLHVDEWEHIYLAHTLLDGHTHVEKGFHFFLLLLSSVFNLVVIYEFLPAIWATLSGGVLFWIIYRWSEQNFYLAWLSVVFFASLKSNLNILGLWFFTPLTFSIPLILLYLYFWSEGLNQRHKPYLITSFFIMLAVIGIHAISFLFAIPIMLILAWWHRQFIYDQLPFFGLFLTLPAAGLIFYKYTTQTPWSQTLTLLFEELTFPYGWGIIEYQNLPTEVYSLAGLILAGIGWLAIYHSSYRQTWRLWLIWPIITLIAIGSYQLIAYPNTFLPANWAITNWLEELTAWSILAPYQRMIYYWALSLPVLSAFGTLSLINFTHRRVLNHLSTVNDQAAKIGALVIVLVPVGWLTFQGYYNQPFMHPHDPVIVRPYPIGQAEGAEPIIDQADFLALEFLADLPPGVVMAEPGLASAIPAMTGFQPVASLFPTRSFFLPEVAMFFGQSSCQAKQDIASRHQVRYVMSKQAIDCGWPMIYDRQTKIYQILY